ncbi:MAG: ATP-dependent sacrificial sulfur transferase LarE [Candidatus Aminicenantes bacterium]|nr:ATP-dependent sacrificial sulfur transferase LarE [Candidatus Aminicenantes bacterium]
MGSVLIAFSGRVDSSFLASVAHEVLGRRSLAVTADSALYTEVKEARRIAEEIGIQHKVFVSDELNVPKFSDNPVNRCYYCKQELFSNLWTIAEKHGFDYVVDGTNYEDLDDYRPGVKAGIELNVRSPLKDVQLTKQEIRALSRERQLSTWDKPSMACLASRFPYGSALTQEKLSKVEKAERFLRGIGFSQLRVRDHGDLARIEVLFNEMSFISKDLIRKKIVNEFNTLGYTYVTVDIKGYRTGSMNEQLEKKAIKKE